MSDPTPSEQVDDKNVKPQLKKSFIQKYKMHMFWALLISVYLYVTMLPEVIFVNGSNYRVEQVTILIPGDDKVWRNIEHGGSKTFRYQPSAQGGEYHVTVILTDGTVIKSNFIGISSWNMGHKAFIELSPDLKLRADFSYSLF